MPAAPGDLRSELRAGDARHPLLHRLPATERPALRGRRRRGGRPGEGRGAAGLRRRGDADRPRGRIAGAGRATRARARSRGSGAAYAGPADLEGAFMAIAATDDTDVNIAVYEDAERRAMLVNVVDVPPLCNFILPAIVRSGPLAIAISTAGASPALAKRMKREIAGASSASPYARLAVLLNEARGWAKATLPTYQDRKEFFESIVGRRSRPDRAAARRTTEHGGARADRDGPSASTRPRPSAPERAPDGARRRRRDRRSRTLARTSRTPRWRPPDAPAPRRRCASKGSRAATANARPWRRVAVAGRGPDARRVRPERRRQDDAAARARDAAAPARGRVRVLGRSLPDEAWAVRGRDRAARPRAAALPRADRAREPALPRAPARRRRGRASSELLAAVAIDRSRG